MKRLKEIERDRRGVEIQHLVPQMLQYVDDHYEPRVQYSLPLSDEDEKAVDQGLGISAHEAGRKKLPYDTPEMENTYHAWEKKNSEYKSFSSEVVRLVQERFEKASVFYHAAGIDKRTYHKNSSDFGYSPSRKTAFRCCIGLKLNVEEAEDLLKLAGMAFSPNDPDDLVLKFCLENGIWDIAGINYMLFRYATRPLDNDDESDKI